ncbi:MAG: aspartate/glutamate racemase family protein [Gammaproteobacteria bacterium]
MKTIGLLGGMSWESTASYYRVINEKTKEKMGKLHSAPIAMISVDFQQIEILQKRGDWSAAASILSKSAKKIEMAGADFLIICTNTMHKVAGIVAESINIPLLHIANATANRIKAQGINKIGLLGTKFTMEQDFYRAILEHEGLTVLTPSTDDRNTVHAIIYDELCLGNILEASKEKYLKIINKLEKNGAQGIIAGCTEIGLLIKNEDIIAPLFDTALIHAEEAVEYALSDN